MLEMLDDFRRGHYVELIVIVGQSLLVQVGDVHFLSLAGHELVGVVQR
jgi:hypothetical protein